MKIVANKSELLATFNKMGISVDFMEFVEILQHVQFSKKYKDSDDALVGEFNRALLHERTLAKHRNIAIILKQDSAYKMLQDITALALQFCNLYNYPPLIGFSKYIKAGLKLMGSTYTLNRFKSYNQSILEYESNELLIESDPRPDLTQILLEEYLRRVAHFDKNSVNFSDFVKTWQFAYKNGCTDVKVWLEAQFEEFLTFGAQPTTNQLYSPKSYERYVKYMANHVNDSTDSLDEKSSWEKLRDKLAQQNNPS